MGILKAKNCTEGPSILYPLTEGSLYCSKVKPALTLAGDNPNQMPFKIVRMLHFNVH